MEATGRDSAFVAAQLKKIGKLLELKGENPFKIRAYGKGADILLAEEEEVAALIKTEKLAQLKGIGEALRQKIQDIYKTGTCPLLSRLETEIPSGVVEMTHIKGLGAKKIRQLWLEENIQSVGELYYACNENRLVELKGFGTKTQDKILSAIEFYRAHAHQFRYADIFPIAARLLSQLQQIKTEEANTISLTGAIRRKLPIIAAIELLVPNSLKTTVFEELNKLNYASPAEKEAFYQTKVPETNIPLHLYFAGEDYIHKLFETTGPAVHVKAVTSATQKTYPTESALYQAAGMQYIAPELRDYEANIARAKKGTLPKLICWEDIKGALHNHSTWSDGMHSIEEMANACREKGWHYFGISDHSKTAVYANGLSEARVLAQLEEIEQLNHKLAPFQIFKGIESDILPDGSLDYPAEILSKFDFIVASIHAQFNMSEAQATDRLIKAIENPYTTILGHPTGRLLLARPGYPVNHKKIIDACAANKVAIEVNANPARLDLDWQWIPYALEKGVLLSINPDAHKVKGLEDIKWGIAAARKGGLEAQNTLNCFSLQQLKTFFESKK